MAQPQYPHGRGGAGNMGKERKASAGAEDLVTPTLKTELYTTGRGGTGNMAKNDFGPEARTAQDVEPPAALQRDHEGETVHYGRGGAANVTKVTGKPESAEQDAEKATEKPKGFLERIGLKKN
ncbi:uncharacterized protein PV09_06849 [Verruconis gallopava]|uniref:Uncharacterized protein n=1 Tax=Verruconis gallopava TaxID=253628 RepID=A0A0D2A572_9PEZI|nr:uncharacterized protein PV09_06849 [Verruconis gallopava]KIW01665.1 hypothetical protein PV09_06849 [Verruconis gallopava]